MSVLMRVNGLSLYVNECIHAFKEEEPMYK